MIKTITGAKRYNKKLDDIFKNSWAKKLAWAVKERSDDPELLELANYYLKS